MKRKVLLYKLHDNIVEGIKSHISLQGTGLIIHKHLNHCTTSDNTSVITIGFQQYLNTIIGGNIYLIGTIQINFDHSSEKYSVSPSDSRLLCEESLIGCAFNDTMYSNTSLINELLSSGFDE